MDEVNLRKELKRLADKLERVKSEGKYKTYGEQNTKKDFIEPLFKALGWDVSNSDEVKAEENVSKKRVDYAFRINGVNKFFLEAKSLREYTSDPRYIAQAIEYAWNKTVPWAILSNFETLRVFNAEYEFDPINPLRNVVMDLKYTEYLEGGFEKLLWLSKESVQQNILEKNAVMAGKKARKLPIDKQLLADFTDFRSILSKDILRNNKSMKLSQENLDEIVQRILNRIIFIRTCEDKEIESEKLESLIRIHGDKKNKLYEELNKKFRSYDDGYNSKLFRKHLCEEVLISNEALKTIIHGTYQTKNPSIRYDFSAIGADILGNIYEQYLGHILRKTSKRAKITNGQVHRKEQGIYYTPTYIVDYIVSNTLGEKLNQGKVNLDSLKIIDPACGSGSFLMKAFDLVCATEIKREGTVLPTRFEDIDSGEILRRKTELMKNCIYGVDLDLQAVEIAQLNLLLKLAEKRRRLPTLQDNIKCGNSLIEESSLSGERAFNWKERFESIFTSGGFDVVIGNPPYISFGLGRTGKLDKLEEKYLREKYINSAEYKISTYALFIELGFNLLKPNGYFGFIIPDSFLTGRYFSKLRKLLLDSTELKAIILFEKDFWQAGDVGFPTILIFQKKIPPKKKENYFLAISCPKPESLALGEVKTMKYSQQYFLTTPRNRFRLFFDEKDKSLIEKIEKDKEELRNLLSMHHGVRSKVGRDKVISDTQKNSTWKPGLISSSEITRYSIRYKRQFH